MNSQQILSSLLDLWFPIQASITNFRDLRQHWLLERTWTSQQRDGTKRAHPEWRPQSKWPQSLHPSSPRPRWRPGPARLLFFAGRAWRQPCFAAAGAGLDSRKLEKQYPGSFSCRRAAAEQLAYICFAKGWVAFLFFIINYKIFQS